MRVPTSAHSQEITFGPSLPLCWHLQVLKCFQGTEIHPCILLLTFRVDTFLNRVTSSYSLNENIDHTN